MPSRCRRDVVVRKCPKSSFVSPSIKVKTGSSIFVSSVKFCQVDQECLILMWGYADYHSAIRHGEGKSSGIFHCYIWLPEGQYFNSDSCNARYTALNQERFGMLTEVGTAQNTSNHDEHRIALRIIPLRHW